MDMFDINQTVKFYYELEEGNQYFDVTFKDGKEINYYTNLVNNGCIFIW